MKITTYALPFRPPFFRSLEKSYSFDPLFFIKIGQNSLDTPFLPMLRFKSTGGAEHPYPNPDRNLPDLFFSMFSTNRLLYIARPPCEPPAILSSIPKYYWGKPLSAVAWLAVSRFLCSYHSNERCTLFSNIAIEPTDDSETEIFD